ncbi:MAG: hypothetical protein ACPGWS_09150 [Solirubrobacterales bacterium]
MRELQDRGHDWRRQHYPTATIVEQAEKVVEEAREVLEAAKALQMAERLQTGTRGLTLLSLHDELGDLTIASANLHAMLPGYGNGDTLCTLWQQRFEAVAQRSSGYIHRKDERDNDGEIS